MTDLGDVHVIVYRRPPLTDLYPQHSRIPPFGRAHGARQGASVRLHPQHERKSYEALRLSNVVEFVCRPYVQGVRRRGYVAADAPCRLTRPGQLRRNGTADGGASWRRSTIVRDGTDNPTRVGSSRSSEPVRRSRRCSSKSNASRPYDVSVSPNRADQCM